MLTAASVEKIEGLEITAEGVLELFQAVATEAKSMDLPSGTLVTTFYDQESKLVPGEYAAEIHFVVRRVDTDEQQENAGAAEEGVQTLETAEGDIPG